MLSYPRIKKTISQHNSVKDNLSEKGGNQELIKNQESVNQESFNNHDYSLIATMAMT